jgi:hypothetical protein
MRARGRTALATGRRLERAATMARQMGCGRRAWTARPRELARLGKGLERMRRRLWRERDGPVPMGAWLGRTSDGQVPKDARLGRTGQRVGADGQPAGAGGQRAGVDEQLTRADSGDDAWFAWFPFAQTRRPARGDGSSEPETAGVQTAALATDRTSIQVQILPPLEQVLTIIGAMLPSTGGPGALALAAGLVGLGGAGIWLRRTGSRRQRGEP